MAVILRTEQNFSHFLEVNPAAAVYFSSPDCGVCQALEPKIEAFLATRFPAIALGLVNITVSRELAAQQSVFAVPTLVVYFEGAEILRKGRAFSLTALGVELERPYRLIFDKGADS